MKSHTHAPTDRMGIRPLVIEQLAEALVKSYRYNVFGLDKKTKERKYRKITSRVASLPVISQKLLKLREDYIKKMQPLLFTDRYVPS